MFVLFFLLGGAFCGGFFMIGLGVYYWGRGHYERSKKDDQS
jgi:hypothetical protein